MRSRDSGRFGCSRERLQQVELERRHRHLGAVLVGQPVRGRRRARSGPMRTRSAPISARARRRRAAQHALDARHQLARIERLRHVVVGAHLEADDAVDDGRRRRQHHDRDLRRSARAGGAPGSGRPRRACGCRPARGRSAAARPCVARGARRSRRRAPRSRGARSTPRAPRARRARRRRSGSWPSWVLCLGICMACPRSASSICRRDAAGKGRRPPAETKETKPAGAQHDPVAGA